MELNLHSRMCVNEGTWHTDKMKVCGTQRQNEGTWHTQTKWRYVAHRQNEGMWHTQTKWRYVAHTDKMKVCGTQTKWRYVAHTDKTAVLRCYFCFKVSQTASLPIMLILERFFYFYHHHHHRHTCCFVFYLPGLLHCSLPVPALWPPEATTAYIALLCSIFRRLRKIAKSDYWLRHFDIQVTVHRDIFL